MKLTPISKLIIRPILITLAVLAIPYMAMKYNRQIIDPGNPYPENVNWDVADFIVMGTLIMMFSLSYEIISLKLKTTNKRIFVAGLLFIFFILIWAELAVGIFNSPLAGS